MFAAALIVAALVLAIVALLVDGHRRDRDIRKLRSHMAEQHAHIEVLTLEQHKLGLRQDRLTNTVNERGWRDSALLTRFNWKKPGPF